MKNNRIDEPFDLESNNLEKMSASSQDKGCFSYGREDRRDDDTNIIRCKEECEYIGRTMTRDEKLHIALDVKPSKTNG